MASPEYQQQQKQQPQNERDSQGDLQHNQQHINMDETFSARTSFTADSPYYTSYVETEMRQVQVLSQTLQEISARAKTFGKCGALMAEATRRLALACRLKPSNPNNINNNNSNQNTNNNAYDDEDGKNGGDEDKVVKERQEAVGEEMMVVLSTLGEVLDEIANAQVQMCENLESSLSHSLEAFRDTQVQEVTSLQTEADQMTDVAEQSFAKYLNGRQYTSEDSVGAWNKLGEHVSNGFTKTWRESADLSRFRRAGSNAGKDKRVPSLVMASTAANLRLTLEQIRLAQTSAELKRFQLLQKLVSIKKRRNFDLGESALASLHGIRAYFLHCSDLVGGLTPRMTRIQEMQTESRAKHMASIGPWKAREMGLMKALDHVGQSVAHASSLAEMMASGDLVVTAEPVSLSKIEEETQIWDLPSLLAESSRYQREPAPGVLVEGWLYKKSSSRMALQQWNKRWFMMDKDGIYYFRSSVETKKMPGGYLHTLERVKICDMVLCTVRECSTDWLRFTFEILTPNQKPILLQARGPQEFKMWVEGIRLSIETQLVSGTVDAGQLMKGIGKQSRRRSAMARLVSQRL
ncbi:Arf-like protein [Fragilaria crotonensis]|nr:Arf-like protein [Fragilaria crotonensis]